MLSPRVELAITTMLEAHGLGRRKAGPNFEATHVLAVGIVVRDHGFDEDAVIGGILHDTLEDTELHRDVIRERFGSHVLAVVEDVTEPPRRMPWRDRKETYIARLRASPRDASRAVASADKIHNLSSMTAGLDTQGRAFTEVFTAGLDDMVWYQQTVHRMLTDVWRHPILDEHGRRLERFLAATKAAR